MKVKELRQDTPLKVIEVSNHRRYKPFPSVCGIETFSYDVIEEKQIQMKIFTDGEIEKESDETSQNINEYYIGKDKYQYDVDTLKTKNIYFKNYSYVITYLIANEWMTIGSVTGWFEVIKEISIYLNDSKDKKALQSAKKVIKEAKNNARGVDYSSLFKVVFSKNKENDNFETIKLSQNVYCLKKQNNVKK